MNQRRIAGVIIISQLFIIFLLVVNITYKKRDPGIEIAPIPHPIERSDIHYNPQLDLPNFYEPQSATVLLSQTKRFPNNSTSTYTINTDSLHDRYEYSIEKPDNVFRIITLGDSFTYGLYLNTEENYTELLEDVLNNECTAYEQYEVINLGVSAYDIRYSLERYRVRGSKYNPDLVLWYITDEDFTTIQNTFDTLFQKYYLEFLDKIDEFGKTTEWAWLEAWAVSRKEYDDTYTTEDSIVYNIDALEKMRDFYDGPLLLFTSPEMLNIDEKFRSFTQSENVYFKKDIGDLTNPKYTVSHDDQHPNELGSIVLARDLKTYLIGSSLVPCS